LEYLLFWATWVPRVSLVSNCLSRFSHTKIKSKYFFKGMATQSSLRDNSHPEDDDDGSVSTSDGS